MFRIRQILHDMNDSLQELYTAFELEALDSGKERLLLTAAVAAGKSNIDAAYEVDKLSM